MSEASVPEIEDLAVRLLDAASLDELLKQYMNHRLFRNRSMPSSLT